MKALRLLFACAVFFIAQQVNAAFALNGSSDAFKLTPPFIGGSAITASAMVKFTSLSPDCKIMGVWQDGGAGYMWLLATSGTNLLGAIVDSGLGFTIPTGGTLTTGVWTNVAIRYNGATVQIFINGVSVGSSSLSTAMAAPASAPMSIGSGTAFVGTPTEPLNGAIAEVAVWNVALTDAEMKSLANFSPLLVRPSAQRPYLPMVSLTTDIISAASITTVGSPTVTTHPPIFHY